LDEIAGKNVSASPVNLFINSHIEAVRTCKRKLVTDDLNTVVRRDRREMNTGSSYYRLPKHIIRNRVIASLNSLSGTSSIHERLFFNDEVVLVADAIFISYNKEP
jgi:hypothetical protein